MNRTIYKTNLKIFFILLTMIFIAVMVFNYFIDGSYQFHLQNKFNQKIAKTLENDNSTLICANYNDRSLKKLLLERLSSQPEILILGSSRSMPIGKELFGNSTFFNASVPSATLQDDIVFYYQLQKKGGSPKVVVINLDQWIVAKDSGYSIWKTTFWRDYKIAKKALLNLDPTVTEKYQAINGPFLKYSQLVSFIYLKSSLKKLPLFNTIVNQSDCYQQFLNGTRLNSKNEESVSADEADRISRSNLNANIWPNRFDPELIKIFESFVSYLTNQHVEVVFYLPPYEPIAYSEFKKNSKYSLVLDTEKYFLSVANKYHVKVIGSYDPFKLNLTPADFIDYIHMKKRAINNLFSQKY